MKDSANIWPLHSPNLTLCHLLVLRSRREASSEHKLLLLISEEDNHIYLPRRINLTALYAGATQGENGGLKAIRTLWWYYDDDVVKHDSLFERICVKLEILIQQARVVVKTKSFTTYKVRTKLVKFKYCKKRIMMIRAVRRNTVNLCGSVLHKLTPNRIEPDWYQW